MPVAYAILPSDTEGAGLVAPVGKGVKLAVMPDCVTPTAFRTTINKPLGPSTRVTAAVVALSVIARPGCVAYPVLDAV